MTDNQHSAAPAYAIRQLARALKAASHPDVSVQEGAALRIEKWTAVLSGMAEGTLGIGSRTPVAETPAWVTLEVAHGGFATGRFLAEGALREHEVQVLSTLPEDVPGESDRERLNLFYASDAGLSELRGALAEGRYEVELPEEAALMVVVWLVDQGHAGTALDLLSEIRPLMHRLRFYPHILEQARVSGTGVHLSTAGAVAEQLRNTAPALRVRTMNTTLQVWNPLYDSLVSLWLTTVDGEVPSFEKTSDGLVRRANGEPVAAGGWPCRNWPSDWNSSREAWLSRYAAALSEHHPSGRHHSKKSNFQLLRRLLEQCPNDAITLSEGFVAALRHALASAVHKHGIPGGSDSRARREEQVRNASRPLHRDIAEAVAARLANFAADEGLPSLDAVAQTIEAGEHPRVPSGTAIPRRFVRKAERALIAPIDELVERGVVTSAEVLAIVLPQITSQVAAAGIADPVGRDLFARTYAAFRRRRSLLLLDLAHQVSMEELPWVSALGAFRQDTMSTALLAAQTLREATLLTFEQFPHTIIPNPLLREMVPLAKQAGIEVPFVEEIAADIFMGTFTKKFSDAAQIASRLLEGSLYARYYDLPPPSRQIPAPRGLFSRWGKKTDPKFDALCMTRSKEAGSEGGGIAKNGAVLEQCQILTSYNLAALVEGLSLGAELAQRGEALAAKALRWAFDRQAHLPSEHLSKLRATKNAAYAFRQAIFFLSFVDGDAQRRTLAELMSEFSANDEATFIRLQPALEGLKMVIEGRDFDQEGRGPAGQHRFLGWSCGPHWLLSGPARH